MLDKKMAPVFWVVLIGGMLTACNRQSPHPNQNAGISLFPTLPDWLLLGGALVLLFLVPVVIIYWPRRTLH